jgi:hypothetical protein
MKKSVLFLIGVSICLCFGFTAPALDSPTWHYNGGSGPQIVVTYSNGVLNIAPNPYNQPLRVTWLRGSLGPYNELVYGSTFSPYGTYDFMISGYASSSSFSDSYYVYY